MAKVQTKKRGSTYSYFFETAKINGKRQRKEKGGFLTQAEAYTAGIKAYDEYQAAGDVFRPSDLSLSDYLDIWYDRVKLQTRNNTNENYEKMIRLHIKPVLGSYRLNAITPSVVDAWVIAKHQKGYAYSTVDSMLKVLKKALDYAIYPGCYIKDNPARLIKVPKSQKSLSESTTERHALTDEELLRIKKRYPFGNAYHIPLMLGYYLGARIGEVLALQWGNIDFAAKTITISEQLQRLVGNGGIWYLCDVKTRSSRRVIMVGDRLLSLLTKWKIKQKENELKYGDQYHYTFAVPSKDSSDRNIKRIISQEKGLLSLGTNLNFVCTQENGIPVKIPSVTYVNSVIRNQLGIANFNFHALRHTNATALIENGAPIKDVSMRLGHSTVDTTIDTYTHNTPRMQRESTIIMERIAKL